MKTTYFKNLDTLRFFCFLSVFIFHSFHTEIEAIKSSKTYLFINQELFSNGNIGVNFFFVLSGFLITYLLIEEKISFNNISIWKFWMRRILRIWPLYFACVFFGFVIFPFLKVSFGETPNETAHLINYLTFTSNFDMIKNGLPDASVLGVLWSVAIEEQFYLVWPIFFYFIPLKRMNFIFIAIILLSFIFRFFNQNHMAFEHHTLSCIGDMAIGSFGAWLIIMKPNFKHKIEQLKREVIIVVYIMFILIFFLRDEVLLNTVGINIFERAFIALVILFIILEQCFSQNSIIKFGRFKLLSALGKKTYGMYCLHFIAILITLKTMGFLGLNQKLWQVLILETLTALVLTVIISFISFKVLESPFLKVKKRFAPFIKKI